MKKIAFCFLIYDEIAHEELWNDFFKSAPEGSYSIYVHYKENKPLKYFEQYKLKECIPTVHAHVSLIHAYNLLFQEAFKDEDNIKFCIVSGTCIPLKSFDYIYNFLTKNDQAHFNVCPKEQCNPYRCQNMYPYLPLEIINKSSGWFILNRILVESLCFIDKAWIDRIYTPVPAPEEFFYITTIHLLGLQSHITTTPNLPEGATTFTNWDDMGYKYSSTLGLKNYKEITDEELEYLVASPCLFGRKFLKECYINKSIIL
jgi:hypothetical protein